MASTMSVAKASQTSTTARSSKHVRYSQAGRIYTRSRFVGLCEIQARASNAVISGSRYHG